MVLTQNSITMIGSPEVDCDDLTSFFRSSPWKKSLALRVDRSQTLNELSTAFCATLISLIWLTNMCLSCSGCVICKKDSIILSRSERSPGKMERTF